MLADRWRRHLLHVGKYDASTADLVDGKAAFDARPVNLYPDQLSGEIHKLTIAEPDHGVSFACVRPRLVGVGDHNQIGVGKRRREIVGSPGHCSYNDSRFGCPSRKFPNRN